MKFERFCFDKKGRMYEIYFSISWDFFMFAVCIADVDFEIHLGRFTPTVRGVD